MLTYPFILQTCCELIPAAVIAVHVVIAYLSCTGDNGSIYFWDWRTGYNFQKIQTTVQPGSLDSEAGIFMCTFDMSGCRLLTAEADKTVKIYKEDEAAVGLS